jgi:hypothetical protein
MGQKGVEHGGFGSDEKKTIVTDAKLWRCHLGGEEGVVKGKFFAAAPAVFCAALA